MYDIIFYQDKNGYSEVRALLDVMKKDSVTNKQSRVKLNKIVSYIDMLKESGTRVGQPVTKHLNGDIWELRPLNDRILYAYYENNQFILLTHFTKKHKKIREEKLNEQSDI